MMGSDCMKTILTLIGILSALSANAAPKLFFVEGYNFNVDLCAAGSQNEQPSRAAALKAIKILERDWVENGQILLKETEKLVQVPFGRKEVTFSYHVCPKSADTWAPPSNSMLPLLRVLSDRNHTQTELKKSLTLMRDTIWHELLHGYLHDHFFDVETPTTPLQRKYLKLPSAAFVHLHLMAIQQVIYKNLNRMKDAEALRDYYKKNLPEYYVGWNAVKDHSPSPHEFIDELIKYKSSHL